MFPGGLKLSSSFSDPILELLLEHLKFAALLEEIKKNPDLCPKNGRRNRYTQIINGTSLVTLQLVQFGQCNRRNENYGSSCETGVSAHHFGELKPVDGRHHDVRNNQGDVSIEKGPEAAVSRVSLHQPRPQTAQHDFVGQELRRRIVNKQDGCGVTGITVVCIIHEQHPHNLALSHAMRPAKKRIGKMAEIGAVWELFGSGSGDRSSPA